MSSLTLKDLPVGMLEALRSAAEDDRRSINQQAIVLLKDALMRRATRSEAERHALVDELRAVAKRSGSLDPAFDAKKLRSRVHSKRNIGV